MVGCIAYFTMESLWQDQDGLVHHIDTPQQAQCRANTRGTEADTAGAGKGSGHGAPGGNQGGVSSMERALIILGALVGRLTVPQFWHHQIQLSSTG